MCCNMKFAVDLIDSNKKEFRYDLIWIKSAPCGFLSARKMPMKKHEIVLVFYKRLPFYDLSTHTHKFLKSGKSKRDKNSCYGNTMKEEKSSKYDPPLPVSVLEDVKDGAVKENSNTLYGDINVPEYISNNISRNKLRRKYKKEGQSDSSYDPPLPVSVLEDVGVSVLEDADCYDFTNRLKNGKLKNYDKELYVGRNGGTAYDPPLPVSVLEDVKDDNVYGFDANKMVDDRPTNVRKPVYDPPLPVSVLEESNETIDKLDDDMIQKLKELSTNMEMKIEEINDDTDVDTDLNIDMPIKTSTITNINTKGDCYDFMNRIKQGKLKRLNVRWDPPLPTSVIENTYDNTIYGDIDMVDFKGRNGKSRYNPPLPTSVLEDKKKPYFHKENSTLPTSIMGSTDYHGGRMAYEPTLPTSVIEDTYEDYILDPPDTLLRIKSQKGRHATQKPTDLMKWAFKYYSKPGDVIFDPTMGSGSTGVAAVQMDRSFIGFERDEEIFKVAEKRIKIDKE